MIAVYCVIVTVVAVKELSFQRINRIKAVVCLFAVLLKIVVMVTAGVKRVIQIVPAAV